MSSDATDILGTFEANGKGGGFLRSAQRNYAIHPADPRVGPDVVKRYGLCGGETVVGAGRQGTKRRAPELAEIESINGKPADEYLERIPFADLTAVDPSSPVRFEIEGGSPSMRVVDLMTPIGFGQRGLIVAAPRTGKTVLLQQMAAGVAANHPGVYMMVLLIDERPEEVTEMRRSVHGEVVASCNDHDVASHVRIARLMIEKAKRHVECGEDVFVLLDSLTRLGRAFNAAVRNSGRIMSGGLDIRALQEPKAIFGAARKIENGGSLTIIASALIETGSRMDEVIFNEFKGTGNMEIMLSRDLANLRIWPAIDLNQSGTRKEELLLSPEALEQSYRIRRTLSSRPPAQAMEQLLDALGKHPNNRAFIASVAK
ncbi:MAG: transcription termination factor Rho [Phycisphaerales bacterium]|nr:MAG: transcription termination factor Rho [Phycisphaerales bacterium]